jgi:hypothetical protein
LNLKRFEIGLKMDLKKRKKGKKKENSKPNPIPRGPSLFSAHAGPPAPVPLLSH